MRTSEQIWQEIQDKFGFVPPFFESVQNLQVLENVWQQTLTVYINNPLSNLFKEKLACYLSRYCAVPYSLICHSCCLHSLGLRGWEVLELLTLPCPTKTEINEHLSLLAAHSNQLVVLSELNASLEESLLYCSIFVCLQTEPAEYCRNELRRLLGAVNYQHLIAFIAYVKTCHVWLEAHPEVSCEADKRVIDNLDILIEKEPGLADIFGSYVQKVRHERQSWAEQQLVQLAERQRYQKALQESEERFQLLVEEVKDYGIFMLDPKGYITSWNAGAERMTGYQTSEIVGKHFSYFYKSKDIQRDKPDRELEIAAAEGRVKNEGWQVRKDGSYFWANVITTALRDEAGNLKGFSKVTRDITECQQHELALQQSEERLRLALNAARMGTWNWNILTGKISYSLDAAANLGFAQRCNPSGCEVTYNNFLELVHSEDREMVAEAAYRAMEENVDYDIEFRVVWSDGTVHWIASKGQVCYYDHTGAVSVWMVGVNIDISSQKQIEIALRESEERFQAFMNNSPTLAFMKDQEGRYVYANRPFEHLFKAKVDILEGKTDFDWLPEEAARQMRKNDLAVISTEQPVEALETVPSSEGYSHYWLVFKFPFQDASGRRLVGGVAVDVTALQRAEAEVYKALAKEKELSELKSHFISTTSHEFRTPLATILSSADMLELYGYKWDESKKLEHLRRIQTAAEHMTELLDNVLLVSKAEAEKLQFKPAPMNLSQFCCDLVEEMQLIAGKHAINFISQGQCTNVCLDVTLLRHILTNLLSNAIKYSPPESTVEFNLVCDRVAAIFSIKDNGIGILEADQAQLFQSFYRGSNVGTTSGTGLGLAIVKKSVDLHGGEVTLTSAVGVGTKFTVTIPLNN